MTTTTPGCAAVDSTLLALSTLQVAPQEAQIRAAFVRAALTLLSAKKGFTVLSQSFASRDEDGIKHLLNAFNMVRSGDDNESMDPEVYNDDGAYDEAIELAKKEGAHQDEDFLRLLSVASDVLSWGSYGEEGYIAKAWPVLCDEVEHAQETSS